MTSPVAEVIPRLWALFSFRGDSGEAEGAGWSANGESSTDVIVAPVRK
jgi:hypothetical protein